ncbi:MAG: GNAT family N-acetyltransferase [Eubacteriales bacterium]|jgi:predicted N-acetyltransferase YhbS|nr:GNAT family N-acetyltransferase [Clostridiales bacterium]
MGFYAGRGDESIYDELMTLLNRSFEFEDGEKGFLGLLPKLYKPEYNPGYYNYVLRTGDGKLKAAVGAYDLDQHVAGMTLRNRGIGNVGVIHEARGEGYMKLLMDMSIDEMIADGVDLSALGGRRMRYRYFSFDSAGPAYRFSIEPGDLRHFFGEEHGGRFEFTEITSAEAELLPEMKKVYEAQPFSSDRGDIRRFFDTLITWRQRVFAAREKETGRFVGYSIGHDSISELMLADEADLDVYIHDYMKHHSLGRLNVSVPYYRKRLATRLTEYAADTSLGNTERYTILNYKNVITAYMRLAATETELADGRVTLLIHGRARDEKLELAVSGGVPYVEETTKEPDFEISHFDAINVLFSAVSPLREKLPAAPRSWLPLPLFTYHADAV